MRGTPAIYGGEEVRFIRVLPAFNFAGVWVVVAAGCYAAFLFPYASASGCLLTK